jgi:hypothetical protein
MQYNLLRCNSLYYNTGTVLVYSHCNGTYGKKLNLKGQSDEIFDPWYFSRIKSHLGH